MKKTYLPLLLSLSIQTLFAQYQIGIIPRQSPDKMIYQKIGYTEVEIRYGSPAVKDRQIWGGLVPYGEVWRAGANYATSIRFGSPVIINGTKLDSGSYAFFLIPRENDSWTAILNKVSRQWGAFSYDPAEDALRLEIRGRTSPFKTEFLSYTISQTGFKFGSILLAWEFMEIEVAFETNYLAAFEQEIESRAEKQPDYIKWIPYLQGAEHLVEIEEELPKARIWIDKAEKIMLANEEWNEQFYPRSYVEGHLYWIKAQILAHEEKYADALAYVEKLKNLSQGEFYNKKNESEGIDTSYQLWKEK
ncbi:MAG: DUF2911 domain-containing protein [Bacteroidia bacterium]|nr:DUF2911 domain-containing protein [Bacteroidia bacterium]